MKVSKKMLAAFWDANPNNKPVEALEAAVALIPESSALPVAPFQVTEAEWLEACRRNNQRDALECLNELLAKRPPVAQGAMPTREALARAIESDWMDAAIGVGNHTPAEVAADAVLRLFAPQEAAAPVVTVDRASFEKLGRDVDFWRNSNHEACRMRDAAIARAEAAEKRVAELEQSLRYRTEERDDVARERSELVRVGQGFRRDRDTARAELAELRRQRDAYAARASQCLTEAARSEGAEAALERVRGLVERWRAEADSQAYWAVAMSECADALERALRGEP
jgi:hypothetical protein